MANSVDPDQTAPEGAVWYGSSLFAYAILSETLKTYRTDKCRSEQETFNLMTAFIHDSANTLS